MIMMTDVEGYQKAPGREHQVPRGERQPRLLQGRRHAAAARPRRSTTATPPPLRAVGIINETAARKYWAGRDPLQGRLVERRQADPDRRRRRGHEDRGAGRSAGGRSSTCRSTSPAGRSGSTPPSWWSAPTGDVQALLPGAARVDSRDRSGRAGLERQHVRVAGARAGHAAADGRDAVRRRSRRSR